MSKRTKKNKPIPIWDERWLEAKTPRQRWLDGEISLLEFARLENGFDY